MAWNQGIDLYGEDDNRFLKGAEYVARYNLGADVPFTRLTFQQGAPGVWSGTVDDVTPSASGRGDLRPIWAMIENHYVNRRGLPAPNTSAMAAKLAPEGGGGDHGPNSGGFDQLGFGTLAFTRDKAAAPVQPPAPQGSPAGAATASASGSPSPTAGPAKDGGQAPGLASTGSDGLLGLTGAGLRAIGGGVPALRVRARRKGAHRA
ncbi:hypothetical protein [Kitasatospora sp. NPDC002522]